jgi:CrcB protein
VLVLCGGAAGAAAREAIDLALPTSAGAFPLATLVINLSGAFALGLLLEALVRSRAGDDRRNRVRLLGGTGFCGAFTTYSTLAVETVQLVRHGRGATAALYLVVSVLGGLLAAVAGISAGAARVRLRADQLAVGGEVSDELPVDSDIDSAGPAR